MTELMKNDQELIFTEKPDFLATKEFDGIGRGNEDVTFKDVTTPRIEVIQALSPQQKENDSKFIPGAKEGMLFNTVTNQLYGDSILFCPVYYCLEYIVFRKRIGGQGGGFIGAFKTMGQAEEALRAKEKEDENNNEPAHNGYEIVDIAQHYGILIASDWGETQRVCIPMASTKHKVSRKFNTVVRMAGGDRFDRVYEVKVVEEKGLKGNYMNLKISMHGYPSDALWKDAEQMYEFEM